MNIKRLLITAAAGIIAIFALRSPLSASEITPESAANTLCVTLVGPAFIIPDESQATIAVHAGALPGVAFVSLNTGHSEGRIPIRQRFLAASMPEDADALTLALSDGTGVRISSVDVAHRQVKSTEVFGGLDVQLAVFTQNGRYLLGVTTKGAVFKVDLIARKIEVMGDVTLRAASIAVSPTNTKLYVAGDGVTVIDIDHMRVASQLTAEQNLLEVAASPDGHTLILRNWHDIELFDLEGKKNGEARASAVVDPVPNGASVNSTSRLAVAADGSSLFYIKASGMGSELISLSMSDLHIEARSTIGPYPNAIAIVPDRRWVLFTAGVSGQEHLEAVDMKTHAVIFKAALPGMPSTSSQRSDRCSSTSNAL